MRENKTKSNGVSKLRQRAEESYSEKKYKQSETLFKEDVKALVHELEVHQIELEMQNEELQRATGDTERALKQYYDLYEFAPVGYFTCGKLSKILTINLYGAALIGQDRRSLLGRRLQLFMMPEDIPAFNHFYNSTLETNTKHACEVRLIGKKTSPVYVHIEGIAVEGSPIEDKQILSTMMDITERKRAEKVIEVKNQELELLLHVTSHDLKEPLRAIENFARLVHDEHAKQLGGEAQDFLQRIVRGAGRMQQLLDDLLLFSRVRRLQLKPEEVEMALVVRDVLGRLEETVQEKGATVTVERDLPRIRVDRTWVTQAVYNLLSNALKFTRPGMAPEVEVAGYRLTTGALNEVGLVVRDRGLGVAPEHRERIFGLFQRAVGHEVEGTGAGLAIVKAVAERHGGRVWVQPRSGGGSEFCILFWKS